MSRAAQMTHSISVGQPVSVTALQDKSLMSQAVLQNSVVSLSCGAALPTSVRGASPELRRIIRKRQNSESAKRCRQRKKIENARTADEIITQTEKVQRLEAIVQQLAKRLVETQEIIAKFSSTKSKMVYSTTVYACRNGHSKCRGTECTHCMRDTQASSSSVPMSVISSPLGHEATSSPEIDTIPTMPMMPAQLNHLSMGSRTIDSISQGDKEHAHELVMALGAQHSEDAAALASKVDEIESSGWH